MRFFSQCTCCCGFERIIAFSKHSIGTDLSVVKDCIFHVARLWIPCGETVVIDEATYVVTSTLILMSKFTLHCMLNT